MFQSEKENAMSIMRFFVAVLALGFCSLSIAQETQSIDTSKPALTTETQEHSANYRAGELSNSSKIHRASEVIGLNVMTPDNEDTIGEVDDLVLDADSGTIRYAAVSVGGFLGIGDKMVAVPWKSFECRKDEDGNSYLSLDTTKEKLEKAPGFDQNNWPDFGNPSWSTENDRHYDVGVNVNNKR
jgi:sporulation protein YlmC with PRC-barrel domain